MRKRLIPLFALIFAAVPVTGCSLMGEDADPALWVVSDADTTIYLFGTVHVLKPRMRWFDDGVRAAFDASDELVLEIANPDPAEIAALARELGTRGGPPFPPEIQAAARDLGMPDGAIDRQEPWLAAMALARLAVNRAGYGADAGVEAALGQAAAKAGKRVEGLETVREQLSLFDHLSGPAQSAMLDATVRELPHTRERTARFVTAWASGDAETVGAEINRAMAASPEVADALIARRNARWAQWVAARMDRPGTVFVAVGAGHLAGKGSVQARLGERGIKVERVVY